MHFLANTLRLGMKQGMGFYSMALFVRFLLQNTVSLINVYILIVLHTEHTFIIIVTHISLLRCSISSILDFRQEQLQAGFFGFCSCGYEKVHLLVYIAL
jgi:hypothetical protein